MTGPRSRLQPRLHRSHLIPPHQGPPAYVLAFTDNQPSSPVNLYRTGRGQGIQVVIGSKVSVPQDDSGILQPRAGNASTHIPPRQFYTFRTLVVS
ncbi:hypothetical protein PENSPDRAFT_104999 [Peniophora sp. CONT]|nr:hypothetical protein PENSPDRAFT_104999 [Peniophora sp. CONT]